jgi:sugar (pentulose or hexulose) kinase
MRVAGIDVGGSSVKAWVADGTGVLGRARRSYPTLVPAPHRAEFDPATLWAATCQALTEAIEASGTSPAAVAGITLTSLRQGFVLLGADGELGNGVLNGDRRGGSHLDRIRQHVGVEELYRITGHWPAPELTLPKLLHVADREPARWQATRAVLFVHDWLAWRLCGVLACEASFACAGQLADVSRRDWAVHLLADLGLDAGRLPPVVESATVLGRLTAEAAASVPGLSAGTPVVSGGGDTQVAAMGLGGLRAGTVTVVAGSSTPVQTATDQPVRDPQRRPWVSTHLRADLWAAETNAGYPGTMYEWATRLLPAASSDGSLPGPPGANGVTAVVATPRWTEQTWAVKAPRALIGLGPTTTAEDLIRAVLEAHAYAIRANIEDLASCIPSEVDTVLLGGGAATPGLTQLVADVLGRPVLASQETMPPALAGVALVRQALGDEPPPLQPPLTEVAPAEHDAYAEPYQRFLTAHDALHRDLPDRQA